VVSSLPSKTIDDEQALFLLSSFQIVGCDKNGPGCLMAAMRHNRPTIVVWGGTIMPGIMSRDVEGMRLKKGDKM
jgi:dihydroxy-acid dehydratase